MRTTAVYTMLLTIFIVSSISASQPKASDCLPADLPYQIYLMFGNGMEEDEFCCCYPCLCCPCGDGMVVQRVYPCPENVLYTKICCFGTAKQQTKTWWCCKGEEPPCECCKVCDSDECRDPYNMVFLQFNVPSTQQIIEYLPAINNF